MSKEERNRRYYKKRKQQDPVSHLLQKAKYSAIKRGLEFRISEEDIKIPETCPYLKIPLSWEVPRGGATPSIDRIDNSLGYIPGNVEVISLRANKMKNNASWEELFCFANSILERI